MLQPLRNTGRAALICAPALLFLATGTSQATPPVAEGASLELSGDLQDPPKPRKVPRGGTDKPKPVDRPTQKPGDQPSARPLDPDDPNYKEMVEKYRRAGLGPDGKPLEGKRGQGGGPTPDVPTDPNAKLVLEFGKDKYDFGRARQGDVLEHDFEMEAGGSSPLIIRQVSPTCGCTVGEVKVSDESGAMRQYQFGDPIPPGSRILVNAKLNTTSKRNQTQVRINVYHNDPVGMSQLSLMANIEPFIQATPTFVNFGDIPMGSTKVQTIDIRTTRGEMVNLTIDDSRGIPRPSGLDIELVPVAPDDTGAAAHWRATVTAGPELQEGTVGYQLSMLSDHVRPDADHIDEVNEEHEHNAETDAHDEHGNKLPTYQRDRTYKVNVSITGRVLGVLSHTPQFLSMGLVRPGQVVPRTVKVLSHDPEFQLDPEKMSIELRGENGAALNWAEHFSTTITKAQAANGVDVELRLNGLPDGADGSFRGEMVVHTGHEAKPTVSVRFSGVCRAGVPSRPPVKGGR